MSLVKMVHPELSDAIEVAESAVPIHMASGWAPVGDAPADEKPATAVKPPTAVKPADKEK